MKRCLLHFMAWLIVVMAGCVYLPLAGDSSLIKVPMLAMAGTLCLLLTARIEAFRLPDALFLCLVAFSTIHAPKFHDHWIVLLGTWNILLFYALGRWSTSRSLAWLVFLASWAISFAAVDNVLSGDAASVSAFFVNRNVLGCSLLPLLWFSLSRVRSDSSTVRWSWRITFGLLLGILAATQSRSAFLGWTASLVTLGVLRTCQTKDRKALLGFSGLILLSALLNFTLVSSNLGRFQEIGSGIHPAQVDKAEAFHHMSSAEHRRWIWNSVLDSWKEHPWLGCGTGSTRYRIIEFQDPILSDEMEPFAAAWFAHSHWLESLHDHGLLGAGIELSLWVLALVYLGMKRQTQWAMGALLAIGLQGAISEALEYPTSVALTWALIGLGIREGAQGPALQVPDWCRHGLKLIPSVTIAATTFLALPSLMANLYTGLMRVSATEAVRAGFYAQARRWQPEHPEVLYASAIDLAQGRHFPQALASLDKADQVAPGLKFTPLMRSRILLDQGRLNESENLVLDALRHYPYETELQLIHLEGLRRQGKCTEFQRRQGEYQARTRNTLLARYLQDSIQQDLQKGRPLRERIALPLWAPDRIFLARDANDTRNLTDEGVKIRARLAQLRTIRCP